MATQDANENELKMDGADPKEPAGEVSHEEDDAIDYSKLDEEIRARGQGYSLRTAPKNILDLQRGLDEKAKEVRTVRDQYKPFDPLISLVRNNPVAAEKIWAAANDAIQSEGTGEDAAPVRAALDPIRRDLNEVKQWRAQEDLRKNLDRVKEEFKGRFEFTQEIENQILEDCMAQNDYKIRRVFLDRYADDLLNRSEKNAQRQTVERIEERNKGYTPVSGSVPSGPSETPDISRLSGAEKQREIDKRLDHLWNNKKAVRDTLEELRDLST